MSHPKPFDSKLSGSQGPARVRGVSPSSPGYHFFDVRQVAKTLAAYGGGAVAYDLALDLVLNEVVEQARGATGATGAAIALARDGEMECRATTGIAAPDLGVKVETEAGLSGACLKTREIQYCSDTESDARVDAQACRELGVRSMLVLPIKDDRGVFGILEVLSARPNAFSEHDIETLQILLGRIVESTREAEDGAAGPANAQESKAAIHKDLPEPQLPEVAESPNNPPLAVAQEAAQTSDLWTNVLVVLVIAVAVLLGVVVGWRGAAKRWATNSQSRTSASPTVALSPTAVSEPKPIGPAEEDHSSKGVSIGKTRAGKEASSNEPPPGGLVVTQNGKVIYRVVPPSKAAGNTLPQGSSGQDTADTAATRLIRRVEPEYPGEARERHIQGPVVLDVQVLADGSVGNIQIVKGNPVLAEAAVSAVRQWRYRPYFVEGQPVQGQTRITINFSLPPS